MKLDSAVASLKCNFKELFTICVSMPICILAYKIISSKSVIVKFYKSFLQYFRATLNEYRPIRFVVENFTGRNMVADNFTAELKSQRVKLLVISPFTSFFISSFIC